MFKLFKRILLYIIYTIIFYIIGVILWGEIIPDPLIKNLNYKIGSIGQMELRLNEIDTVKSIDVLFIGSSTTYRGFDTRIFQKKGIKSFNLGSSAQTPIQTEYLLKKYLPQINTGLIVIDVNPLMFTIDGVESSLDLIANDNFNKDLFILALNVNNLKVYNTLIYAYYKHHFYKNDKVKTDKKRGKDTYISGGFIERDLNYFKEIKHEKQEWNFNKKQFKKFDKLIKFLQSNNYNYILVQTPIAPNLYFSRTNNVNFDLYMGKKGEYLNFNSILQMNDSLHYFDSYHLNQNGVEIYNKKLANHLKNLIQVQN